MIKKIKVKIKEPELDINKINKRFEDIELLVDSRTDQILFHIQDELREVYNNLNGFQKFLWHISGVDKL